MKPCTKIIIALWVFFLLSFVVKAQRAVGNGTPITSGGGEVTRQELIDTSTAIRTDAVTRPELADSVSSRITQAELADSTTAIRGDFPADGGNTYYTSSLEGDTIPPLTVGNLATLNPGYTYSQLKTIRQANWESFQAACNWARTNNGRVLLPASLIEFHLANGETIVLDVNQTLHIEGAGKGITTMQFYPHAKIWDATCFDLDEAGSNLILKNLSILSEKERTETYNVILRPGGNANEIQITSASVYSHTAANFIGKTVYASTDNVTLATSYTVTNYNSGTKTLTVSGTVTGGNDDAGIMGIFFLEDTPLDSIRVYGNHWRTDNVEWELVYAISSTDTREDDVDQLIKFDNVSIIGFDSHVGSSGTNFIVDANDSYFSGHIGSLFMYSNFMTDSYIKLHNCVYEENSHAIVGYINGSYTAGNLLGSAIYSHPNHQWIITNCIFKNNNGGTARQYSGTGSKPTPSSAVSFINNCQWYNNQEYDILTSETMPSYYTNCSFSGTTFFHNNSYATNCEFKGTVASYDSGINIFINNSTFTSGARISINERNSRLELTGCTFTNPSGSNFTIEPFVDHFVMRNCTVKDNGAAGVAGYTFFAYGYSPNTIIDNCRFEDTNQYLWWRTNPYMSLDAYTLSQFNPLKITNSYFAYAPFLGYYSNTNNIDIRDCDLSWVVGNAGVLGAQPNKKPYRRLLTGSTITISPKYNHYLISGAITKIAVPVGVAGTFYFTAVDTVTFTAYANPGNTGSNLNFTGTVLPGETISMYYDNINVKSNGTTVVTGDAIDYTDGAYKCFSATDEMTNGSKIEAGSVVLTCGAVTLTDNGDGTLTGTGGYGWIDYFRNNVTVCFDLVPTVSTPIVVDYRYHNTIYQQGMWSKID